MDKLGNGINMRPEASYDLKITISRKLVMMIKPQRTPQGYVIYKYTKLISHSFN